MWGGSSAQASRRVQETPGSCVSFYLLVGPCFLDNSTPLFSREPGGYQDKTVIEMIHCVATAMRCEFSEVLGSVHVDHVAHGPSHSLLMPMRLPSQSQMYVRLRTPQRAAIYIATERLLRSTAALHFRAPGYHEHHPQC